MRKSEKGFEEAMKELEEIVETLEKGDLTLDESIKVFQRGIELSKFCSKRLNEVERKITMLIEDQGDGSVRDEELPGIS